MGTKLIYHIKYVLNSLVSIFYCGEEKCILCGEYTEEDICKNCKSSIKIIGIEGYVGKGNTTYPCYSLGYYSYGLKKLILSFKFHKEFRAGRILSSFLADYVKENIKDKIDYITYIPSSRQSMKKRGFNQCRVLAEWTSKMCGIPCISMLIRVDKGKDQIGLSERMRWENLKDAFCFDADINADGKDILIIDDVVTTGATTYFAADLIKKSGIRNVYILTVVKSKV